MTIPNPGQNVFWERIESATETSRTILGRTLRFFVQPTREDCLHACTVDDITHLMRHVPRPDWEGLEAIVLRQPRRKEEFISPVWGRLAYAADLVNARGKVLYSGPAIILEARNPTDPFEFGKGLSPDGEAELERLKLDGHLLSARRKHHTFEPDLESCRATQLYRTLLHELGHWVDFLEKVERPSLKQDFGQLLDHYHSRASREKEAFAHRYSERLGKELQDKGVIPFARKLDPKRILHDKLNLSDFEWS